MAQESQHAGQDEIEQRGSKSSPAASPAQQPPATRAGSEVLNQDEIEALLPKSGQAAPQAGVTAPAAGGVGAPTKTEPIAVPRKQADHDSLAAGDVEFLLRQAEEALASVDAPRMETAPGLAEFRFEEFGGAPASTEMATLELIRDVELDVRIELGRTEMHLEDVLRLRRGSVVALDKLAGDPVDIHVNGRLVARGEVLVLNENFCVRVNELVAAQPARTG
jgi:flagellar motor switch protein FliN/FliY